MTDEEALAAFLPLRQALELLEPFDDAKPLLAHYTSVNVLECILKNEELWFSNPLFMNDRREVRFALTEGRFLFETSDLLEKACKSKERYSALTSAFDSYFGDFENRELLDTYVFCLSEHDPDDTDGRLSMWRGYGANGNGAAIVFDTSKISMMDSSPLIVAKVRYMPEDEQKRWLASSIAKFCEILEAADIPVDKIHIAAWAILRLIRTFALFTKHQGFREEQEWRVVYFRDRDDDKLLDSMFDYWIGARGVEPKLKFKVQPLPPITADDLNFTNIVDRIILGPTVSSPLSKAMVLKMLDQLGKPDLKARVHASTIPLRFMQSGAR